MRLSIVCVNWNSTAYLRACIASIDEWMGNIDRQIVVVDNASPDDDIDELMRQYPDAILIKSPMNLGFGRANNLGFRYSNGDCILFLNPDTRLNSPAIQAMLATLEFLPDAGVVGCRLLNGDLSVQTSCIQRFPAILNQALDADFLRRLWPNSRLWGTVPLFSPAREPISVEVISGACMLIRREVFERIGMFSDEFFMYGEDLDLCYKAVQAGYRNYYVGSATVIHYGGGSSASDSAAARKWESILRYCQKHRGSAYACALATVMGFVALARLTLLGAATLCHVGRSSGAGFSSIAKWRTVLTTVWNPQAICGLLRPPTAGSR